MPQDRKIMRFYDNNYLLTGRQKSLYVVKDNQDKVFNIKELNMGKD
jgi:hypothetical protein